MESIPSWFVIVMGLGTVFVGLICLVLLCKILGLVSALNHHENDTPTSESTVTPTTPAKTTFSNRQEVIAAIGAVIAEDLGVDVTGIQITSIRRI